MPANKPTRTRHAQTQSGLSLLEFTLIVIVIGVLMTFVMQRAVDLRVSIEQAAVERTVAAMQGGLALAFAEMAVQGELERVDDWAGGNPLALIEGEDIFDPDAPAAAADIGPGRWFFDEASGEVVYQVRYADALGDASAEGRWRVVTVGNSNGRPSGLRLEQTRTIDWP